MARRRALALLLLPLVLSACLPPRPTSQVREASFEPFAGQRLDRAPLGEFLRARTALVMTGAKPLMVRQDGARLEVLVGLGLTFDLNQEQAVAMDFGAAAALTPDGYYLTAAHTIHQKALIYLAPFRPQGAAGVLARVVWCGDPAHSETDFAILKADVAPAGVFEWAASADLQPGAAVVLCGPYGPAGGHVRAVTKVVIHPPAPPPPSGDHDHPAPASQPAAPDLTVRLLTHDLPVAKGDSGGPLATAAGQLAGINFATQRELLNPFAHWEQLAVRPDPAWVARVIREDRAGKKD